MKRTLIALLCLMLLAVAACSSAPSAPAPTPSPVETQPAPAPESAPTPVAVDYGLSQATRDKVAGNLKSTTKYALSESYTKLALGQHHTFGLGFTNRLVAKDNFLIELVFKRAIDKSSNTIDVATAQNIIPWLAHNDFSITPLNPEQQSIQPIVIEVTSFTDGSVPPPGTYEFTARVLHQGGFFGPTEEYSGDISLAVQVV
ncbi:MAG TPA: hypothetical protein VLJ21_04895 [Candidatus Binatia bacterium]|nr:hypothetical protein [Candidatus Binatia bacterium]